MGNSAGPKITKDGLVLDFDAANLKSYNFYADPYASNVSLHLKMDGANGSTTFTDSSPNGLAVTAVGNAQISTAQSKYNGTSAYFDGSGDYLSIAATTAFGFGTGDYTAECWINITGGQGTDRIIFDFRPSPDSVASLFISTTNKLTLWNGTTIGGTGTALNLSQWYHVALCRSSGVTRCYLNGVQDWSSSVAMDFTGSRALGIGSWPGNGLAGFFGHIDDLRITKYARYTSAFTSPPIPSTCTDLTRSKNVGTLTGGVDYNFSNGGSLVFDGTNDYVKAPFNSNYNFGSGDFTVSAWINMTVLPSNNWSAFVTHGVSGSAQRWVFYYDTRSSQSSPGLRFSSVNASNAANIDISVGSTSGWSAGIWYYVTITRVGNVFTLYRNGIQVGNTVTDADAIIDVTSNGLYLGMENTGVDAPLNGKISLVQIYKGKGLTSTEVYNNFVANRGRFGV
jgi:hypothetical protein